MIDDTTKLSVDDLVEFLAPIIDVTTCDEISLNKLRRDHKEIISKLNQADRPVLLRVDGQALLLCNAHIYFELETKRQCVLSRFKSVEDAIQIGKIDVADPRINELQMLQDRTASLEAEITDSNWKLEETKKELANTCARVAVLTAELKQTELSQ